MKNLTLIILLALFSFGAQNVTAQKLGYINSQVLLAEHPKVKAADAELETLQKQLASRLQKKEVTLKAKYDSLIAKEKEGTITAKDFQDQGKKLQEEEYGLQEEGKQLQQQLLKKREELYQPILDEINTAIQSFAKEGAYLYIFDQSAGMLLFADESQDVSGQIKTKLGI